MRYLTAFCLSAVVSLASVSVVRAQGDSDPGLSMIGAMRTGAAIVVSDENFEHQRPQFSLSHTFARGEKDVKYDNSALDIRVPLEDLGYFDVRVPITVATGQLAHKWGLGDINFAYTHVLKADPMDWTVQATAGIQIGMTTANFSDGSTRPLPMSYQSGLGSTDAMAGVNVTWKEYISLAAGYQQAIFRYNENDYYRSSYVNDPIYSNSDYTISRKLYRFGDIMVRAEGHYVTNRAGITMGALGFYHVKDDLYQDRMGLWNKIQGSEGATLNLVGNVFYRFARHGSCKLDVTFAMPVIKRDVRPDGLERQFMITPRFTYYFNQRNLLF
ncbi:MAG: hypothetical protein JST82_06105 [Bacteroidetes bacterium]|nr:hypothetical protein [Bacteroidota bacterium]